ncbi:MAG: hypothetical protein GEV12_08190 [Micromonosporaceae bacterium]|nr:hypothetical protein [Micromonosporaceae bacterium]
MLPLRPLTVGELLDAAVALLRTRAPLLVGLGAVAAGLEQAVLFPLRRLADVDTWYLPPDDRWPAWTLLVLVGFATEAAIIAALGAPAAAAAPRALLGPAAPPPEPGRRRVAGTATVALLAGGSCGLAVATTYGWPATFFLLSLGTLALWSAGYGLLGLAVPAVVIDRLGPVAAVRRSVVLSSRGLLRTGRVRVLAYLGWFVIRLAWGLGALSVIGLFYSSPSTTTDNLLMALAYLLVNALAYPMLACLDVVLHLEARMRTEGLDIALRRSLHRGVDPTPALVGR